MKPLLSRAEPTRVQFGLRGVVHGLRDDHELLTLLAHGDVLLPLLPPKLPTALLTKLLLLSL